jgi:hypothetical protein
MICDQLKFNSEEERREFHRSIFNAYLNGEYADRNINYKIGNIIYNYFEISHFIRYYLNNFASDIEKNAYFDFLKNKKIKKDEENNNSKHTIEILENSYYEFLNAENLYGFDILTLSKAKEYNLKYASVCDREKFELRYFKYLDVNNYNEDVDKIIFNLYIKSESIEEFKDKLQLLNVSYEDASKDIEEYLYKYSSKTQRNNFSKTKEKFENIDSYMIIGRDLTNYDLNIYFKLMNKISVVLLSNLTSSEEKQEKINELIKSVPVNNIYLKSLIRDFVRVKFPMHSLEFQDKIYCDIRSSIVYYFDTINHEKKVDVKEKKPEVKFYVDLYYAKMIVLDLTFKYNGNITNMIKDLCSLNNNDISNKDLHIISDINNYGNYMYENEIKTSIAMVKEEAPDIYDYYNLMVNKKDNTIIEKKVNDINTFFKNSNDFVSYWLEVGLPYDSLYYLSKKYCSTYVAQKVNTFISNNKIELTSDRVKKSILLMTNYISKLDENGKAIPGTSHAITTEEINDIFAYIKNNNIPFTDYTYNIIKKRWYNGDIDLTSSKCYTRTKK